MKNQKTILAVVIALCVVAGVVFIGCCGIMGALYWGATQPQQLPYAEGDDLAAARSRFRTKLLHEGPAPQEYENTAPPKGVSLVQYTSGELQLNAWLSDDPGDGKRRPAVVYLHGGWAFGESDWDDAAPFVEAGFVLMMPMLRAENGNPGSFEHDYGEVDDAVAAGKHVAALPYVDSQRVFVAGHSAGAVLAVLVAMVPSDYQAAAALSGYLDYEGFVNSGWQDAMPYDLNSSEERRLRNPMAFVGSLRLPVYLYAEQSQPMVYVVNQQFANKAKQLGKQCEFSSVPGDHMTMVQPAVKRTIANFQNHSPAAAD
ncbi:MAG: prolyl oligopeptidase family serine peptidase [Planctomycetota bacterium]